MVDVDDVQGYGQKFQNQWEKLQDAAIPDADHEAIERLITHCRANEDVNKGTLVSYLNRLRLASERATTPLVEMEKADVDRLVVRLEDEYGLAEGTIRNYKKALRRFFEFYDEDWHEEIVIGASPNRKHDPDEELRGEEIDVMLEEGNARDRALIALLADTGLRIGGVLSLRIRDLDIESDRATVSINSEANVKDDDGPKPVTWSRSYVATWLQEHPRSDDPDAPLIHVLPGHYDPEEDGDGALRQQYASQRVSKLARDAGLDPDRVHAHLFRDTAVSNWIREGLSDQAIKHRAGWSKDSRMFDTYSRVRDEEMNEVIFEHYGIEESGEKDRRPDLDQCPSCRTPLRGAERYCPECAYPLDSAAADEVEEVQDEMFEDASVADADDTELFSEFRRRFNDSADFRERISGGHADSS